MSAPTRAPLQFSAWSSSIQPSFWHALTKLKLEVLKLADDPVPVWASYSRGRTVLDRATGQQVGMGATLDLGAEGLEGPAPSGTSERGYLQGVLRNFNTIEEFKNADKTALMDDLADRIWNAASGAEPTSAEAVTPFLLLTFADLKKYKYYYWLCFPALLFKGWQVEREWGGADSLSAEEGSSLADGVKSLTDGFALAKRSPNGLQFGRLDDATAFFSGVAPAERTLVFLDASTHPTAPAWPLRNVLTHLATSQSIASIRVIAYRDSADEPLSRTRVARLTLDPAALPSAGAISARPGVVGWEKNDKGKLGPRLADLAPLMDPTRLADQAVDLNLQLMRWRILPELDLDRVKHTRVLLLGAGTLGCYVARTLMAWGVRRITLVDSSTVSFSNPVRQPLFEFADSTGGGKPKAQAAAAALKRIYPGVEAEGVTLAIPMPGHPVAPANVEQTKRDVHKLEQLISEHDVVYLLMDSRESRWLPTVIGAAQRKLVMNVALGFDTFLVMRHGVPPPADEPAPAQPAPVTPGTAYTGRLGCYYCNDIVAPMDSLTDRTLDQMCTVTRPGIASIASSTAVELMVSVLQHPKGSSAPSDIPLANAANTSVTAQTDDSMSAGSCLGIVPHQIRGFLAQFHNLKITGQAYNLCTGCSPAVVGAYEEQGYEMLAQAFEDAKYLERLTGLDQLAKESEAMMEGVDWDDEDEGEVDDF